MTKDVKTINDIPNIEKYLDTTWELACYERGDNTQIWEHQITDDLRASIEIISDESLINGKEDFIELINQDNIGYFCFSTMINELDIIESYHYRPAIAESEKIY